jgi:hypothetical protein
MFAAPVLIDRSMTNFLHESAETEKELNPRWRPDTEKNGHRSPRSETNIYHLLPSRPPHFPLPTTFKSTIAIALRIIQKFVNI